MTNFIICLKALASCMLNDDITLFVSGSSINQVQERLQICVNETLAQ